MNTTITTVSEASHLRERYNQKVAELNRACTTAISYRNGLIGINSILEKACTEPGHQATDLEIEIAAICYKLLHTKP